jgi:hypothetical protein
MIQHRNSFVPSKSTFPFLRTIPNIKTFLPTGEELRKSIVTFLAIVMSGLILTPLVMRLPILGWDWYYFFTAHSPDYNLYSSNSAYPPYAHFFIELLSWIKDWRLSLAVETSLSLVVLAIATWRAGGRYGSIILGLLNGVILMHLWAGHPDAIGLIGFVTGFVPLALIKPQIVGWSLLSNRKLFFWTILFLMLTLLIWPMWPLQLTQATVWHEAAAGWSVTGWVVPLIGVFLLIGAGNNPWRLMAAGAMISPYLMPYQMVVIAPAIGAAKGWRKAAIWLSTWLVAVGLGVGGASKLLYYAFPLAVYLSLITIEEYKSNIMHLRMGFDRVFAWTA